MGILRSIGQVLRKGRNLDAYLTILVAIVIGVLSLLDIVRPADMNGLVLAVLGLIAIGLLATRAKLDDLGNTTRSKLDELVTSLSRQGAGTLVTRFPDSYEQDLKDRGDVWIYGVSRRTFVRKNYHQIRNRLRAGSEVRVLLVKPGSPGAVLANKRIPIDSQDFVDSSVAATMVDLRSLMSQVGGQINVRFTDQELSFGAVFVNPNRPSARMYLENYAYQTETHSIRMFLTVEDEALLDLYREQLENLWRDSSVEDLQTAGPQNSTDRDDTMLPE